MYRLVLLLPVVLNTYKADPDAEKLSYDIHFWIGEESTQDEYGVAAYKTVELDDLLGGAPVQHRQTMGHETEMFLSYFPNGLIIKSGGIESGFHHVTTEEYKPHLLQIHRAGGKCRAYEVDLAVKSMDKGDCFILDSGAKVYVYLGEGSDPFEKNKAASLAENMISDRNGKATQAEVDEAFWTLLGGTEAEVTDGESAAHKVPESTTPKLYSMEDETHEWKLIKEGAMTAEDIKDDDVQLLDVGTDIFVCVGSAAPEGEKKDAMILAQKFLVAAPGPNYIPLHSVKPGQNPNKESWTKAFSAEEGVPPEPEPEAEPEPEPAA